MGDSAEFEKLGALEARLAAAFDRIAAGVANGAAKRPDEEAPVQTGALVDRIAALESQLAETQQALADAEAKDADAATTNAAELEQLRADLAAKEEERAEAVSAQATLQARISELERAAQEQAQAADDVDVAVLKRRVERARTERDAAIEARDAAQDLADEMSEAGAAQPEERVLALRAELRGLRTAVDQVSSGLDELRSLANGDGSGDLNRVLEAQVAALTEARRAEAAELGRILSDLMAAEAVREGDVHNA